MTTALPASARVEHSRRLVGSPEVSRRPSWVPRGAEWRDRSIIPGKMCQPDTDGMTGFFFECNGREGLYVLAERVETD